MMSHVTGKTDTNLVTATPEAIVDAVLQFIRQKQIPAAIALFDEAATFVDYGLNLKFDNRQRLREVFNKQIELYPDSLLTVDLQSSRGDNVTVVWTLNASVSQPALGGRTRSVAVVLRGASLICVEMEKSLNGQSFTMG
jgi:hypothetical protein